MMRWLKRKVPLPFGLIDNRRSLVGLDNLVDLILTTVEHPNAAGQTFLVSDDEDVSTPELLTRTAAALGTSARLVSVPPALLAGFASLVGKRAALSRLCGSLQVDVRHTRMTLGWSPPSSVDSELARTARHFLSLETH
jgi:nucleoside-diphosphate-sugar epimerase